MGKTLFQVFEDKITESMEADINIQQFNVEYYALDPSTVSDVITAKEQVSNTGNYHLKTFCHDLSKTIAQKQNGEVTITFAMSDLVRKKQYLMEIKYTHNREKGIGVYLLKANGRESKTNINSVKMNESIITPKERIMFSKIAATAPESFPALLFNKLIYIIYYSLKAILKTENFSKKNNEQITKDQSK